MWSSSKIAIAFLAVVLAGCGFRPMYAPAGNTNVLKDFAGIEIGVIEDRVGQQLRNELLDLLTPHGRPAIPRYVLNVELRESITSFAVERSGLATRSDLQLNARYSLADVATGKLVIAQDSSAISSYNLLDSDYATLAAQEFARTRAVQQLAQEIRTRIAVYFRRKDATTGKSG